MQRAKASPHPHVASKGKNRKTAVAIDCAQEWRVFWLNIWSSKTCWYWFDWAYCFTNARYIAYIAQLYRYLRPETWMLQYKVLISAVLLSVLFTESCLITLFCVNSPINCRLVSFSLDLRLKAVRIYVHLFSRRLYHIMLQIKAIFSAPFWTPSRPLTGSITANFFGCCWNVTYLHVYSSSVDILIDIRTTKFLEKFTSSENLTCALCETGHRQYTKIFLKYGNNINKMLSYRRETALQGAL